MKFEIILLVFLFLIWPIAGQNHDLAFWGQKNLQTGEKLAFPWYSYTGKGPAVDLRYNFEAEKTGTICIGKKFGTDGFDFIPQACGLIGKYPGFGPALVLFGEKGKNEFYLLTEYMSMMDKNTSFAYSWIEYHRELIRHFSVGLGGEVLKDKTTSVLAIGPSFKCTFGKMYIRVWPSWPVGSEKSRATMVVGIGYMW